MYLLDTNIVSELRKAKTGKADVNVCTWAAGIPAADMLLSVISVLELETGVLLVERRDSAQGAVLRAWLDDHVMPAFAEAEGLRRRRAAHGTRVLRGGSAPGPARSAASEARLPS